MHWAHLAASRCCALPNSFSSVAVRLRSHSWTGVDCVSARVLTQSRRRTPSVSTAGERPSALHAARAAVSMLLPSVGSCGRRPWSCGWGPGARLTPLRAGRLPRQPDHSPHVARSAHVAQSTQQGRAPELPELPRELLINPYKTSDLKLLNQKAVAGGRLDLVLWQEAPELPDRLLRVWTPPGFVASDAGRTGWPVLYLHDGQNLYDDRASFSGASWRAAHTASQLIADGTLPPFVIVGMDHSGPTRSLDYTPYRPGTGPGGFRTDAAGWPGGGVDAHLDGVTQEVMPYVQSVYGVATDPDLVAFGGSSFGGICTLVAAMRCPGLFGAALVESPSLWLAEERFLTDIGNHHRQWPQRMFVGMGGKEFTGIRAKVDNTGPKWDALVESYAGILKTLLTEQGLTPERLRVTVDPAATHNEAAWQKRLPGALKFLLRPWWSALTRRHETDHVFTFPRGLRAGQHATIFFNQARSESLASKTGPLKLCGGLNRGQAEVQLPLLPMPQDTLPADSGYWHLAQMQLPPRTYELAFSVSDEHGSVWDSGRGSGYYLRASLIDGFRGRLRYNYMCPRPEDWALLSLDEAATKHSEDLFFAFPTPLEPGRPAWFFMNKARSALLRDSRKVKMLFGWNDWKEGAVTAELDPAQGGSSPVWSGAGSDWWGVAVDVPATAFNMHLCFTDGDSKYENNNEQNFLLLARDERAAMVDGSKLQPREVMFSDTAEHAGGQLHVLHFARRAPTGDEQIDRFGRWAEEKCISVWTPPGCNPLSAPPGGWPVLYILDAPCTLEDGVVDQDSPMARIGRTASQLVKGGDAPPFVVVSIDGPGVMRSQYYLPYEPGAGAGGFRPDAARWPGGHVGKYMQRMLYEIMPTATQKFNLATDPSRVALGGSTFGGVASLYAALHYPHVFGAVLSETPSLWIAEGRFVEDIRNHTGMLPERIYLGRCAHEAQPPLERDSEQQAAVLRLLRQYDEDAVGCFESHGLNVKNGRLHMAPSSQQGQQPRLDLASALKFLLGPWKGL